MVRIFAWSNDNEKIKKNLRFRKKLLYKARTTGRDLA